MDGADVVEDVVSGILDDDQPLGGGKRGVGLLHACRCHDHVGAAVHREAGLVTGRRRAGHGGKCRVGLDHGVPGQGDGGPASQRVAHGAHLGEVEQMVEAPPAGGVLGLEERQGLTQCGGGVVRSGCGAPADHRGQVRRLLVGRGNHEAPRGQVVRQEARLLRIRPVSVGEDDDRKRMGGVAAGRGVVGDGGVQVGARGNGVRQRGERGIVGQGSRNPGLDLVRVRRHALDRGLVDRVPDLQLVPAGQRVAGSPGCVRSRHGEGDDRERRRA